MNKGIPIYCVYLLCLLRPSEKFWLYDESNQCPFACRVNRLSNTLPDISKKLLHTYLILIHILNILTQNPV